MQKKIDEIEKSIDEAVKDVQSSKTLQEIKMRFLGKTGEISSLMKNMRDVTPEHRPSMGKLLNALRQWSEERFAAIELRLKEFELKKKYADEKIDVTLPGRVAEDGAFHPNTLIRNELISVFAGMGFEVSKGPKLKTIIITLPRLIRRPTTPQEICRIRFTFQKICFCARRLRRGKLG